MTTVSRSAATLGSPVRHASCQCGALAIRCLGEPLKVSLCHCTQCQKRSGSLFGVAAFFPAERVEQLSGDARTYSRASDSGFDVSFHFCPACGTSLWWEPERMPGLVAVAVGAFADRNFPMPDQAVWSEASHPWLELPEEVESHARNPLRSKDRS